MRSGQIKFERHRIPKVKANQMLYPLLIIVFHYIHFYFYFWVCFLIELVVVIAGKVKVTVKKGRG